MSMLSRKSMVIAYGLVLILTWAFSYLLDFDLESSLGWEVGLHYLPDVVSPAGAVRAGGSWRASSPSPV